MNSSRSVWLGADGILAGSATGSTLVTSATLSPGWIAELADACRGAGRTSSTCRSRVSGWRGSGALTLLAAAIHRDPEAIHDVLASARRGPPLRYGSRSGPKCKLVLNALQAVQLVAFGEAMAIARAAGLDPENVGPTLVERLGGPVTTMAWAADQQLPERANFALAWASEGSPLRRSDGRRPAGASCWTSPWPGSPPQQIRVGEITTGQSPTPWHRPAE